jgi:hypothetical protein
LSAAPADKSTRAADLFQIEEVLTITLKAQLLRCDAFLALKYAIRMKLFLLELLQVKGAASIKIAVEYINM